MCHEHHVAPEAEYLSENCVQVVKILLNVGRPNILAFKVCFREGSTSTRKQYISTREHMGGYNHARYILDLGKSKHAFRGMQDGICMIMERELFIEG